MGHVKCYPLTSSPGVLFIWDTEEKLGTLSTGLDNNMQVLCMCLSAKHESLFWVWLVWLFFIKRCYIRRFMCRVLKVRKARYIYHEFSTHFGNTFNLSKGLHRENEQSLANRAAPNICIEPSVVWAGSTLTEPTVTSSKAFQTWSEAGKQIPPGLFHTEVHSIFQEPAARGLLHQTQ